MSTQPQLLDSPSPPSSRAGYFRWIILALLTFGTAINYLDRGVMGFIAQPLQTKYHISDIAYGNINLAFGLSYALSQLAAGGMLDRIGTRLGYGIAMIFWSLSAMMPAFARSAWQFGITRVFLGVSESPNYPAANKAVSEWFPRRERAFAFGFVNAGCNLGIIFVAIVVPFLTQHFGLEMAFLGTGALGFVLFVLWMALYDLPQNHSRASKAEVEYILSDPAESTAKIPWSKLLTYRQAWAFGMAKFFTDAMWWFYITWFPKYMQGRNGLDISHLGKPMVTIYTISIVGSLAGGWLSSVLIHHGASVNVGRKVAMWIASLMVVPMMFAFQVTGLWTTVLLLGIATAGHQAFSSNLYTLVSDMFPKRATASVSGLGGMFGYVSAAAFQPFVGYCVQTRHNYIIPFVCAGSAYLIANVFIQILVPKLEPAKIDGLQGVPVIPVDGK